MKPEQTWVALVHHPVYDKNHKVVATALTNLDLHDIARSSRVDVQILSAASTAALRLK